MDMSVYDGVYYHLKWNWNFYRSDSSSSRFLVIALARFYRAGNDIWYAGVVEGWYY